MKRMLPAMALMAAVACGGSTASSSATPATAASPSPAAVTTTATVAVASNGTLGKILVDGTGKTLYLFEKDTSTVSTCYSACATFWPPLLTKDAPQAGAGVSAALLGTTKRTDGTLEVTYAGHPLYYVITDHNPGDATGQNVTNFGAAWFVLGPDGKKIGG